MFNGFFVVFFGSLRFLGNRRRVFFFHRFFMVLFSSLRFLYRSFVVFFVMHGFRSRCCGCRWCSSVGDGVSSECSRRETHCSGNNQS